MLQTEINRRVRLGDPDPHLTGGTCGQCYACRRPDVADEVPLEVHRVLAGLGVCVECPDGPVVVPLDWWHEGGVGGCWGPA